MYKSNVQASRASIPQFLGGEPGSFDQCLELEPDDFGIHLDSPSKGAKAAIDPGHQVASSDHVGVSDKALCHQLRVLDEVGGGIDNTRDNDLPLW